MSAHEIHAGHDDHGHDHDDLHVTKGDYVKGFILAVILTVIPFWLVMGEVLESRVWTVALIMLFGAVQIVVHMVYFLHMNRKSEGGWILSSLLFTGIIIVIALAGSLWVMHHLNTNMMPMSPEQMRVAP